MTIENTKLRAGTVLIPVNLEYDKNRVFFHFKYNKKLIEEIKTSFESRHYHGFDEHNPRKIWSAPLTQRNKFRLEVLKDKYGTNPYARYDADCNQYRPLVIEHCRMRGWKPREHQIDLMCHAIAVKQYIWASEMGTGKTLAAFVVMEISGIVDWMWVAPKSAIRAFRAEMKKWKPRVEPNVFTYEGVVKLVKEWKSGTPAPHGLIGDESSKCKNHAAQRTQAMKHVADAMREEHGADGCFIGLMSGSPAPKSPVDWFAQCEIVCPGFLKEANPTIFRNRLGLIEQREIGPGGGSYPHLVTWHDDENKCKECGKPRTDIIHQVSDFGVVTGHGDVHEFKESVNEVAKLYDRMKGLVVVKMKKDCLDLPDKIYEIAKAEPTKDILNAAKLIVAQSRRAIEALTLLRELSDGFQYSEKVVGTEKCPRCNGTCRTADYVDPETPDVPPDPDALAKGVKFIYEEVTDDQGFTDYVRVGERPIVYEQVFIDCPHCKEGRVDTYARTIIEVPCPKDELLAEQLDLHMDVGRLNVYAGFTASVDRVIKNVIANKWGYIRADGRGWIGMSHEGQLLNNDRLLDIYDKGHSDFPRLVFIGQPGAAGMGLTLTASPTTVFWSNDFNGESRMQAEDRGHRMGMDMERGGRIVDFIHLDSDMYVLNNLQKKKNLQQLSMEGVRKLFV